MQLAKGLRAIQKNYSASASTTLDIVDALESELRTNFGDRAANLLDNIGEEGAEPFLMEMFRLAKARRLANANLKYASSYGALQRAFREHTGDAEASIDAVDQEYATQFLEYQKGLDKASPERVRSQHLQDYMEIMSQGEKEVADRRQTSSSLEARGRSVASEAYSYRQARKTLEGLEGAVTETTEGLSEAGGLDEIGDLAEDITRSVRALDDEAVDVARSPYRRITSDVFKSKNVRRGTLAAAALIGASFLYQSKKAKDHTASDIQGPPLLPGGNPYETEYPTRQAIINQVQQNNMDSSGMQYQINTSGSMQDLNRLRGLFGDVIDGPINSTMYNGLPMMGQDPYSDVASRF